MLREYKKYVFYRIVRTYILTKSYGSNNSGLKLVVPASQVSVKSLVNYSKALPEISINVSEVRMNKYIINYNIINIKHYQMFSKVQQTFYR